jgi:hypothetical protein
MSDRRIYRRSQASRDIDVGTLALIGFMVALAVSSILIGVDKISPPKAQPMFPLERATQLQGSAEKL